MAMPRLALRQRREQLDLSQETVAQLLGVSTSTYREWESGDSSPRVGRRRRLAEVFRWSLAQLSQALDGPEALNGHAVPTWLGHLASLEQGASEIRAFEATTVHGLLQTPDYSRAVELADAVPKGEAAIAQRVDTRVARQAVLTQPDPLKLAVILDESILRRVAGSREIMADQLAHIARLPRHVDIRVLALAAGVFVFGSFAILTSPGSTEPYMAVVEDRAGPHYLDRPNEVEAHVTLFNHLSTVALPPDESRDLLHVAAEEYRHD